ncbi:MAG TPA: DUF4258 domain-containing protein [Accumulibacter sp.]|uniref:DUF4258 domain-containing protein n=1 Tax=Accumulibacter sp. TaxID=2053492 RepID=UPI0025D55C0D|nr:DUF4258 domain-containing protein [Accumulibacter sp.]MCM8598968.1 DUF4258 domain-containing protein [Accumulibacter sp.]MCM8663097.1 DUF4258 domain-containing protein [Accumulibacter sp.]HNC52297.1 DUF4258 domain-containing protein [Accumulibacter sp.]
MAQSTIVRIRNCVRSLNYVVSIHAAEELDDDNLTILDLEITLLTSEIVERQHDRKTDERKFVVRGATVGGLQAEAVVKFGPLGNLFIITVHLV